MSKENLIASWRMQNERYKLTGYLGNDGKFHIGAPHPHNVGVDTKTTLQTVNTQPDNNKDLVTQISSEVLQERELSRFSK